MTLAERMKAYEGVEAKRRCDADSPVLIRLDGKGFSKFTRSLTRPFDPALSALMIDTMRFVVEKTGPVAAYTQSDEITLMWLPGRAYCDGRVQKIASIAAAYASAYFNRELDARLPSKAGQVPVFDARVWAVPTLAEAANVFVWRARDALRNSVSMAASAHYSHRQLLNKSDAEKRQMLDAIGVDFDALPAYFRIGTLIRRVTVRRRFDAEELARLPPRHAAHSDPDLEVERSEWKTVEPFFPEVHNRVEVLTEGAPPMLGPPG
jgi:tRNA(His) 5'-end guanylyltransferase